MYPYNDIIHKPKPWKPARPVSSGAVAYHMAVVNAPYYFEALHGLVSIIRKRVMENELVVDFGAGTGVSALYMLKNLKLQFKLLLVDNSAAWLGKAYEIFKNDSNVDCFLLEKVAGRYATLGELFNQETVNHVVSANTVHLIPDLDTTFKGISDSLKPEGTFTFQSGNITRSGRKKDALMVDDTVKRVHDIALETIRTNEKFSKYRECLNEKIKSEANQRKAIFPDPKPLEAYLRSLKDAGFKYFESRYKLIRIKYNDWLNFLRVKRLQTGILPEIGGNEPSGQEEQDRDILITMSAKSLFKELEEKNSMADDKSFTVESVYVLATKTA